MEDRHSVSEPRPVGNDGMPSWEVDILRDDTVIVDTFLLDNVVLPPRTNKKGKVVWRLPDKMDKLPSFGTDDRRRILDIFKDRKKKRKQEKKKRNLSPSQSGDPDPAGKCERRDSTTKSPGEKSGGGAGPRLYERSDSSNIKPTGGEKAKNGAKAKAKLKGKESTNKSSENTSKVPDGITENGNTGQKQKKKNNQVERGRGSTRESPNGPQHALPTKTVPPGMASSPTIPSNGIKSSTPPIGQNQNQPLSSSAHAQVPSTPDPSRMSLDDPGESSVPVQTQSAYERPMPTPQSPLIEPPPIDALFIAVPRNERPQTLPGQPEASLAVPAARHFIGKYYAHFEGTLPGAQIGDLIRYYTSKAQKSVSIGGAHSVVTGRRDISAQILNLAGAAFVVRGVVAQDTADGKGVHILVTGTARTSLNGAAGGVLASFAHSISLVPIDDGFQGRDDISPALREAFEMGFPFQLHNDALALLSGDAGPVTPTPILQPAPLQPPGPPPGLF